MGPFLVVGHLLPEKQGCLVFVFIPSVVFIYVEENWTYLDAVYFSVISLTKIGFGDLVPSTSPPLKMAK